MNRILAVRPGDDVSALRRAISEAFHAKGDTDGGNLVNAQLSDMTEEGGNLAVRRGVADELAYLARANPADVAAFRGAIVSGALLGVGAPPPEETARSEADAQGSSAAIQRRVVPEQAPESAQAEAQPVKTAIKLDSPPLPSKLVGTPDKRSGMRGDRYINGPLAPENGGTGDAEKDFNILTGGNHSPALDKSGYPAGTQVGKNRITLRPAQGSSGPRIDIPANGAKPHETLHY
jgi:hypothetical protein